MVIEVIVVVKVQTNILITKHMFDIIDVSERISLIMREKNLSKRAFAKLLDCSDTAINNITTKRNEPGYKILNRILQTFDDISPEWLVTGKGKMYRQADIILEPEDQETLKDLVKSQKSEIEYLRSKLDEKDKVISNLTKINLKLIEKNND